MGFLDHNGDLKKGCTIERKWFVSLMVDYDLIDAHKKYIVLKDGRLDPNQELAILLEECIKRVVPIELIAKTRLYNHTTLSAEEEKALEGGK